MQRKKQNQRKYQRRLICLLFTIVKLPNIKHCQDDVLLSRPHSYGLWTLRFQVSKIIYYICVGLFIVSKSVLKLFSVLIYPQYSLSLGLVQSVVHCPDSNNCYYYTTEYVADYTSPGDKLHSRKVNVDEELMHGFGDYVQADTDAVDDSRTSRSIVRMSTGISKGHHLGSACCQVILQN